MQLQNIPPDTSCQLPVSVTSHTPIIDAIQLAQQGYQFTDAEIAKLQSMVAASRAARERERRRLLRLPDSQDHDAALTSAVTKLNDLLTELPYMLHEPQEPSPPIRRRPSPQPSRPAFQPPVSGATSSPAIEIPKG